MWLQLLCFVIAVLDLQDAFSSMYHLMNRYGKSHLCDKRGPEVLTKAAHCAALLREAASSAAIVLWAAVSLPTLSEQHAAMMLAQGFFFGGRTGVFVGDAACEEGGIVAGAWKQQVRSQRSGWFTTKHC
jgi:hypothetical protein